eukprot:scaffold10947_cov99-Phaeocystis_antarctica.AAC.5
MVLLQCSHGRARKAGLHHDPEKRRAPLSSTLDFEGRVLRGTRYPKPAYGSRSATPQGAERHPPQQRPKPQRPKPQRPKAQRPAPSQPTARDEGALSGMLSTPRSQRCVHRTAPLPLTTTEACDLS